MSDSNPSTHGSRPGQFVPPALEDLDAVLSAYEFLEILGQGGMGAVYKVRQHSLDRIAAIKVMPKFDDADEGRFAERFQREAQAMGQLTHNNIVAVYDFGQTADGMLYIVMEYVEGADLQQLMRTGELTLDHLFDWIPQICAALNYAHSKGIVHRDIKPGNIMIGKDGTVKVTDFGLAKLTGMDVQQTRLTVTNMTMGTPDYVAPEALEEGVEADHRADIYAVGVMLYEMLTGKIPRGAWHPPSTLNSHIDSRFDDLVTKAMDADRDSRFQDVSEISAHLTAIWTTTDDNVPIITEPEKGSKRSSKIASQRATGVNRGSSKKALPWLWIALGAVAGLIGIAAVIALNLPDSVDEEELKVTGADVSPVSIPKVASGSQIQPDSVASRGELVNGSSVEITPASESPPDPDSAGDGDKMKQAPPSREKPGQNQPPGNASEPAVQNETAVAKTSTMREAPPEPSNLKAKGEAPEIANSNPSPAIPAPETLSEGMRRVSALFERYRSGYESKMLAPHRSSKSELDQQYTRALAKKRDSIAATGNLDEVIAFREEIERINSGEAIPESVKEVPTALIDLRKTYREQVGRLEEAHLKRVATLIKPLDSEFDSLEKELTKSGLVDDALEVREERLKIRKTGLPFVDLETVPLFSALSPDTEPVAVAADNSKPISESDDSEASFAAERKAAEWVLSMGGGIEIQVGESTLEIKRQEPEARKNVEALLPASNIKLISVNLRGNRDISSEEFARFPPSPNLRRLDLNDTLFSDRRSARVLRGFPVLTELVVPHAGADEWAKELENVPSLRKVAFYRCLLSDDGMRDVAKVSWLTSLNLSESRISPRAIDSVIKLTNLEVLELSNMHSEFDVEDLQKLAVLSKLTRLTIHNWNVTPAQVEALKKQLPECEIRYSGESGAEVVL